MKRTLYLIENGKSFTTVSRDGPSVWIKTRQDSGRRVPVRFIDKVVIIGNVRIDVYSLILFTENQIPVLFINNRSEEKAFILPYNHRLNNHYKSQRAMAQSMDSVKRYKKWIKTKRMFEQLKTLRKLFKGFNFPDEIGEGNYQFIIKKLKTSEPRWSIVKDIVENFIRGVIMGRLIRAGLDPHYGIIHRRVNYGLLLDLSMIFAPAIDLQSIQFFQSKENVIVQDGRLADRGIKTIIDRFESNRLELVQKVEQTIDELFEIMKDIRK
ncbi:CRISPR-associated endonuclease Cas1 [Thermodesulfovibrio thiophilus]|uniref:CRISPR-associated endonuclease Cas1 n=1 Tax=Thermodesulfovibrio thiophilus TaxID=340095 RepID=UPI00182C7F52|nr:CRISPR-associated endonuclease Cas1 [Thermodesulfovibrio thiophilus]HHW20444.1 hypothetical protein [Thermodesulfovibrio thiophilus]